MKIHLPDDSEPSRANDWQNAQTDSTKWKQGFSAHALAHTWQPDPDFPPAVLAALRACPPLFSDIKPVKAHIERATKMPGAGFASFTDLLVFAESAGEQVVIGVEGKCDESFGNQTVGVWRKSSTSVGGDNANRETRLAGILEHIGLTDNDAAQTVRYQLLHRMAATVIEADKTGAKHAVLLVHSFSANAHAKEINENEFAAFVRLYHRLPVHEQIIPLTVLASGILLYAAWVSDTAPV